MSEKEGSERKKRLISLNRPAKEPNHEIANTGTVEINRGL